MQRRRTYARRTGGIRDEHPLWDFPGHYPGEGPGAAQTPRACLMDAATRRLVWKRAEHRCEYCRLHLATTTKDRISPESIRARAMWCACSTHVGNGGAGTFTLSERGLPVARNAAGRRLRSWQ